VRGSTLLVLLGAFFLWSTITVIIKAPDQLSAELIFMATALIAYLAVSEGPQGLRGFGVIAGILVLFSIALASLGVTQGLTPTVCYTRVDLVRGGNDMEVSDGRPCDVSADCVSGGIPGKEYRCEHPGLLDTHSIGGRVRYRGILEDPNELSWAINMAVPLAFGLYERRRTLRRLLLALVTLVLGATCVIMTQSRSGQLGILAALGVYFIRRLGWKGVVVGAVASLPLLILGGRSGESAESSSEERLNAWNEAYTMFKESPVLGVGKGQFIEHYFLTAHNSFLLALAEIGPFGLFLWCAVLYYAVKVTVQAQRQLAGRPEAATARNWATAVLASLTGLIISALFLTLNYHTVLWINIGLVGALYNAVRIHEPTFRVRFGWRDAGIVVALEIALVGGIAGYLRMKGI
jgi:hypothetical protein